MGRKRQAASESLPLVQAARSLRIEEWRVRALVAAGVLLAFETDSGELELPECEVRRLAVLFGVEARDDRVRPGRRAARRQR